MVVKWKSAFCRLILPTACFVLSLLAPPVFASELEITEVPFKYVGGHILVVPVHVGDRESLFVLDTGAGVNVLSHSLAEKLDCKGKGTHSGRRMSGQKLSLKTTSVPSLKIGTCLLKNVPVAIWKMDWIFPKEPKFAGIEGFVSLDFFKSTPFTVDYQKKKIFIENEASLVQRLSAGFSVPVRVEHKHVIETVIKLPLSFSNGKSALVEVDTGSDSLILNEKYMKVFGIVPAAPNLKIVRGKDETEHAYLRYFCNLPVDVSLSAASKIKQSKPDVMFQKIIYDGLIGDSFLHNFIVTYDLANKRMIFASPNH